jgi:hypothetical protein
MLAGWMSGEERRRRTVVDPAGRSFQQKEDDNGKRGTAGTTEENEGEACGPIAVHVVALTVARILRVLKNGPPIADQGRFPDVDFVMIFLYLQKN